MNELTEELFWELNDLIEKFMKKHPDLQKSEIAFNVVAMFSSTLINLITKGESLEKKFRLLDDLFEHEKKWIEFDYHMRKGESTNDK